MAVMDKNKLAYIEEAQDLLIELENGLLELDNSPEDNELINRVFRALHTIKGSGAMFGFEAIAAFTHNVENAFDRVRDGAIKVEKNLLDLTLQAKDHIAALLKEDGSADPVQGNAILAGFAVYTQKEKKKEETPVAQVASNPAADVSASMYRIRFKPNPDIFLRGINPLGLLQELADLGQAQIMSRTEEVPDLSEINPEQCSCFWDIILSTTKGENAIRDVFIFVEDDCELSIQLIQGADQSEGAPGKFLGEILVERGEIRADQLEECLNAKKKIGELLIDSGLVSPQAVESALVEQESVRKTVQETKHDDGGGSVRVPAAKLDHLVDLVGELVTAQARLSQFSSNQIDTVLRSIAEDIELLSNDLRDTTLNMRMLPIGTTFSKFKRLVRDLSKDLGKEIELLTEGAETELDKTVIERLGDPLVHLLRNSIDHGVEMPDVREKTGKSRKGTIILMARHSGGEVHIEIKDDGRGIDTKKILKKAVEKGLVQPEAALTEKEILDLIFLPGLSTATKVTNVSGRGVGMDVVKRNIEALHGRIETSTTLDKGTSITIRLPLTLAIINGLQVRINQEFFVLPLSLVEECVELRRGEADQNGKQIINLRGEIVPYIRLRGMFGVPGETPPIEQVVVARADGSRIGIVVDEVVGEHQTVIKSLGRMYKDVKGVAGATIKGDGSIALILDVPCLMRIAQTK